MATQHYWWNSHPPTHTPRVGSVSSVYPSHPLYMSRNVRNLPSNMCTQRRFAQSDQNLHWTHIGSKDAQTVSSCGQQIPWSDCVGAKADLSVRWAHLSEGTFSYFGRFRWTSILLGVLQTYIYELLYRQWKGVTLTWSFFRVIITDCWEIVSVGHISHSINYGPSF